MKARVIRPREKADGVAFGVEEEERDEHSSKAIGEKRKLFFRGGRRPLLAEGVREKRCYWRKGGERV